MKNEKSDLILEEIKGTSAILINSESIFVSSTEENLEKIEKVIDSIIKKHRKFILRLEKRKVSKNLTGIG